MDLSSQVVELSGVTHRIYLLHDRLVTLQTQWDLQELAVCIFIIILGICFNCLYTFQASSSFLNLTQSSDGDSTNSKSSPAEKYDA